MRPPPPEEATEKIPCHGQREGEVDPVGALQGDQIPHESKRSAHGATKACDQFGLLGAGVASDAGREEFGITVRCAERVLHIVRDAEEQVNRLAEVMDSRWTLHRHKAATVRPRHGTARTQIIQHGS